jgi:glycosyl-4,4'-diaponeurosporenoate acyltransferase
MPGSSSGITIVIDFIVWFVIHIGFTIITIKMPDKLFDKDNWIYRIRPWEKNGRIWQTIFRVKTWKDHLPDGAALFKKGFKKKRMTSRDSGYIKAFILESRRGELTHWLILLSSPLFFIWNPAWLGFIMILYAVIANLPCIIAQRYNRPRLNSLLALMDGKEQTLSK